MIINRANYESYLLDYLEGNLPAELLVEMEMFLSQNLDIAAQNLELDVKTASNPELKKSLELYFSTKLQADIGTRLTKEEKKRLKRKTAGIIIPLWLKSAAVAAAVIFGLFLIPQEAAVDTAYEPREENSFIAEIELEYADIKNGRIFRLSRGESPEKKRF